MKLRSTVAAVARSTPGMLCFRVKRIVRDKAVPLFASRYERQCSALAASLPPVIVGDQRQAASEFVSKFYAMPLETALEAGAGRFSFHGDKVDFGDVSSIDWSHRRPSEHTHFMWRMKLSQMGALHTLIGAGTEATDEVAIGLIRSFSRSASFASAEAFSVQWAPYEVSHRLLSLISGLDQRPRGARLRPEIENEVREFISFNAAVLRRNLELELMNNHTERNLAALTMFFSAAGVDVPKRIQRLIRKVLKSTVLPDGMQVERSAMYQCLTLMSLEIFSTSRALRPKLQAEAQNRLAAARSALAVMTHQDGDIALFNDSWLGEAPPSNELLGETNCESGHLPHGGYAKFTSGDLAAFMDFGPIGPKWNPGHGHDDALSVEVDIAAERFIVDPGTTSYDAGAERDRQRNASSHNGPYAHGRSVATFAGSFRVERLPVPPLLEEVDLELGLARASVQIAGGHVTRQLRLQGGRLTVRDTWFGHDARDFETRLLIPSDWSLRPEGRSIHCAGTTTSARIDLDFGEVVGVDAATWSMRFKQRGPANLLRLAPRRDGDGRRTLLWSIVNVTKM